MEKITYLFLLLTSCFALNTQAQTVVQDFEDGSPAVTERYGCVYQPAENPNTDGNSSINVGRVGRTSTNWFELISFDIEPYTVAAGETMYLHVYVNYPAQPDVSVRFDATTDDTDGTVDIRALNTVTVFNEWQDLVFQLDGGDSGVTVTSIVYLTDLGFQNEPAGFVLNNEDAFAYLDNYRFTDSAEPENLSIPDFELFNAINIYPNPTNTTFKIDTSAQLSSIAIYDVLGKSVKNISTPTGTEYDISDLEAGLYIVQLTNHDGKSVSRKLLKQ